ncbi:MAG: Rpp14/Pop5 family protein [Halobacteriales archaeon]
MKHLPKHLRPRYRYLWVGIEAWPDADLDRRAFQAAVWAAARGLLGDAGSAAVDPTVVRFAFADGVGTAVVRVRRGEVDRGRAALACIASVDGNPVGIQVRGTSGTIHAGEERYMRARPEQTDEKTVALGGTERAAFVRSDRVDVRADSAFAGATDLDLQR